MGARTNGISHGTSALALLAPFFLSGCILRMFNAHPLDAVSGPAGFALDIPLPCKANETFVAYHLRNAPELPSKATLDPADYDAARLDDVEIHDAESAPLRFRLDTCLHSETRLFRPLRLVVVGVAENRTGTPCAGIVIQAPELGSPASANLDGHPFCVRSQPLEVLGLEKAAQGNPVDLKMEIPFATGEMLRIRGWRAGRLDAVTFSHSQPSSSSGTRVAAGRLVATTDLATALKGPCGLGETVHQNHNFRGKATLEVDACRFSSPRGSFLVPIAITVRLPESEREIHYEGREETGRHFAYFNSSKNLGWGYHFLVDDIEGIFAEDQGGGGVGDDFFAFRKGAGPWIIHPLGERFFTSESEVRANIETRFTLDELGKRIQNP